MSFLHHKHLFYWFVLLIGVSLIISALAPSSEIPEKWIVNSSFPWEDPVFDLEDGLPVITKQPENQNLFWSVNGSAWFGYAHQPPLTGTGSVYSEYNPEMTGYLLRKGRRQLLIPTSFRWSPPCDDIPDAIAITYFSIHPESKERSPVKHKTFFYSHHSLPVVSIYISPPDLFDYTKGIYVVGTSGLVSNRYSFREKWWDRPSNYHQRGRNWVRNAFFQVYEKNKLNYEADAKIRIHGNASRSYPQKSLRLEAAGKELFNFDFFNHGDDSKYESIILRNSGNDWDRTLFADGLIHTLVSHSHIEVMADSPCIVYINGNYWGIHNLRERINEENLSEKYSVGKTDIVILEDGKVDVGYETDFNDFSYIADLALKSGDEQSTLEKIAEMVNLDNLLDYFSVQLYFANTDWPYNNAKYFKIKNKNSEPGKQKWNFVLWDMDFAYGYNGPDAKNYDMFNHLLISGGNTADLFNGLLRNHEFKKILAARLDSLLNGQLSTNNQLALIQSYRSAYLPEIKDHSKRWRKPASVEKWEENIEVFVDFAQNREAALRKQMKQYLE